MEQQGHIHIYTGNGKGKTTAAFGLAVRALFAGKRVYIGQFVKSMKYHETRLENLFDTLTIRQFGRGCFIRRESEPEDVKAAQEGMEACRKALSGGAYDLVILDELTIALYYKLVTTAEVLELLLRRAPGTEVVITGRYAPDELIEAADLVTEMREVKHYYAQGVEARDGIER